MRTLLSINNYHYFRGGAETVFLKHNELFQAASWRVATFSMSHPKNLPSEWANHFVDEIELGSEYGLLDKLIRVPKVIYSLEARRKLRRLIDIVKPNICHAHNIYHHISPSILSVLRTAAVPTVLTLHDLKIACPAYSMLAADGVCERCRGGNLRSVVRHRCIKNSFVMSSIVFAEAWLHRWLRSYKDNVDCFVVPSKFYIQKFCEWGFPATLFRHVPNFVDVENSRPQYRSGERFVYVGRLSREKGLPTLIRAAAASGVSIRIVGTGPLRAELESLAESVGADVEFAGFLSGSSLHDVIRDSLAVVLPSEWYENAPLSILEAYALGKPVIGAQIGGIPELIRQNCTGLLFTSGDVESLSEALRTMAERDGSEVAEMGFRGRKWVEEEFTTTVYRDRILAIYGELGVGPEPG